MRRSPLLPLVILLAVPTLPLGFSDQVLAEEYLRRGASSREMLEALKRSRGARPYVAPTQASSPPPTPKPRPITVKKPDKQQPRPASPPSRTTPVKRPVAATPPHRPPPSIYRPPHQDRDQSNGVAIYFGFASARITGDAATALKRLGQALANPELNGQHWIIEGHTDASGSAEYNQRLSEQRAEAAQRYLVDQCGLDARLLTPVGRGEEAPYDRAHPYADINRRVSIKPVDPPGQS